MDDDEHAAALKALAALPSDSDAGHVSPHHLLGAAGLPAGIELASTEDDNEVDRFDGNAHRTILKAYMKQGLEQPQRSQSQHISQYYM